MMNQHQAYQTVVQLLEYLRDHADEQPGLNLLAEHARLSPGHLQRLFTQWVGISPKRFLQYLTKQEAKQQLRRSRNVLDSALASGLSGPGRLYDLMVQCDAVTPGEYGAQGEGLSLIYGVTDSPFGRVFLVSSTRGICQLSFIENDSREQQHTRALSVEWSRARLTRDDEAVRVLGRKVFHPLENPGPLSVLLKGTNFQIKVWEALLQIKSGCVLSYSDVAGLIGSPRAHRAVGSALAVNRIAYLIPCHRVIRESGDFGSYHWSSVRKRAMLEWERARSESGVTTGKD